TSKPLMRACPAVRGNSVVIIRMSVDLPAPFGPRRPKISPCCTLKETSSTAVKSPYFLLIWSTTMASPLAGAAQWAVGFDLEANHLIAQLSPESSAEGPPPSCQEQAHHRGCRPLASSQWS